MPGKYFDEFEVGEVFRHQPGRTVTETDNLLFSALTMNPQPLHLDVEFSKQAEFGQRLVNSIFTLGLAVGLSKRLQYMLSPFVDTLNAVPRVTLLPLIIIWFGIL